MAEELKETKDNEPSKPEKITVNILNNDGTNIKLKIKLLWTIFELKEHLYSNNYIETEPFNQIISLHGTDLQNTQTFENIYMAIKTSKDSKGVLRSLRGQLTWEDNNLNVDDLINDNNNNDNNNNNNNEINSSFEIQLYVRTKSLKPKQRLATLHSHEPILEQFISSQKKRESISIKSVHSDTSSSSSTNKGYGISTFSPDAIRKKQEQKALKQLTKTDSSQSTQSTQSSQSNSSSIHITTGPIHHKSTGSVIFHNESNEHSDSNSDGSDTSSNEDSNSSMKRSRSPESMNKKSSKRKSLYADISHSDMNINENSSNDSGHDNQNENDIKQSELTQENLYMHTHKHNRRISGMSSVSIGGNSADWGGGPFIVKRMSIGSISSGMPTNLEFYHVANQSSHLWELDLPDYYDNMPDSLQKIYNKLDAQGMKQHKSIDIMDDLDENKEMEININENNNNNNNNDNKENEMPVFKSKNESESSRKSVRFSEHVIYKSDEIKSDKSDNNIEEIKSEEIPKNVSENIPLKSEMSDNDIQVEEQSVININENIKEEKEEEIDKKEIDFISLEPNIDKWKVKQVGVDNRYVEINKDGSIRRDENENESDNESESNSSESEREQVNDNKSDGSGSDSISMRSNNIYDIEQIKEDKIHMSLTWKTSYFGIFLIGIAWTSSFHCLYSFSAIVSDIVLTLNVKLFEFGLMYSFNFIGVGIGLLLSSYILNKPQYISSSLMFCKWSIFIIFITQFICTCVFLYEYAIDSKQLSNAFLWIILVISRFIMGVAIGFNESSINNLVFEWFSDDAFNNKLSNNSTEEENNYVTKLSSRVLSYCLFLKEFGHISARLFLVPLIYLTFSDGTNLFVPLLLGVILSGIAWCGMVYTSYKDRKTTNSYSKITDIDAVMHIKSSKTRIYSRENESDNDSESTPLLHGDNKRLISHTLIPEDWSYSDWYDMELIGLNKSVILSIVFLSINFGISFSFTILSITNIVEQYNYTDYTANLLICLIPICSLFGSNWFRKYVLSRVDSVWTVMFIGCILYAIVFGAFAFVGIKGTNSIWLPIICVIIFIFGSECVFASGYELLLSSSPEYIHGLISGVNSSANFIISGIFILIFSLLVIDYSNTQMNIVNQYRWAYAFCCFASIINLIIAIILRNSFGSHVQEL